MTKQTDESQTIPLEAITDFAATIAETLKDNFIGFYLGGSITRGCWNPHRSDIDFLVVTKSPLSQDEIESVKRLHERFKDTTIGPKLEGSYVNLELLQKKAYHQECLRIEAGVTILGKTEISADNILDLIQNGKVILGWAIPQLALSVSEKDVKDAVYSMLVEDEPEIDTADIKLLYYILVNSLRCIYTLKLNELPTKPAAIEYSKHLLGGDLYRQMMDYQAGAIEQFEIDRVKLKEIIAYGKSLKNRDE